ncbi:GLUTATHIONE S-TRANSFERASE AMINO-TERMINAL DOMAIN PROTEIN [Salix purpurea]|uniref:glutathione transferase n=1 Tax=Salix purpurea TaxID=77065 RepID=A0A9Q0VS61_SALPP|nr:GLUTATHIONE S-TRANSFERASE AMINO-TERMINAL DOMAIN PROTEIN [Salix purpurea]
MAGIKLLDSWASPSAMKVRIALAEKGIEYESKEEDLTHKSPLLLEMNPVHKQIPVLIHNGKAICESMIIVEYIDEVWNEDSSLLPSNSQDRTRARQLIWSANSDNKKAAAKDLVEFFKVMEGELGRKPYFGGDRFGFVDVALVPFYGYFYTYETFGSFSFARECPMLVQWGERCLQRESVSKNLPDPYKAYEFVLEHRKKLGIDE